MSFWKRLGASATPSLRGQGGSERRAETSLLCSAGMRNAKRAGGWEEKGEFLGKAGEGSKPCEETPQRRSVARSEEAPSTERRPTGRSDKARRRSPIFFRRDAECEAGGRAGRKREIFGESGRRLRARRKSQTCKRLICFFRKALLTKARRFPKQVQALEPPALRVLQRINCEKLIFPAHPKKVSP